MNHLAHALLAGSKEPFLVGAFLGDHVRGTVRDDDWPPGWAAGIRLHRRIDSLSDAHRSVQAMLARLQPPWRRYGGVILDVLFDHMLTRHWSSFASDSLQAMAERIDTSLARHADRLPTRLRLFSRWARNRGLWLRYGEREMLNEIFQRLGRRHGRPAPLADGLEVLDRFESEIEATFLELFPDLAIQAGRERDRLQSIASSM